MATEAVPTELDSDTLRRVLQEASQHLRAHRAKLNAINVYPVPDGDTGSNMAATFDEAVAGIATMDQDATVGDMLQKFAKAALYGARGNSGVILSQALRGLAEGTRDKQSLDAEGLAEGLHQAAEFAYKAVAEPREGTMLTVLREAAAGAAAKRGDGGALLDVLDAAIETAEAAEAATIDQLPQLKEAGVTDSGGEGVCVILRGVRSAMLGEPVPTEEVASDSAQGMAFAAAHSDEEHGFCVEFLVSAKDESIDAERLRGELGTTGGRSVVVIGDDDVLRVHVHADDARAPVAVAEQFGAISRLKVDDMGEQASRLAGGEAAATARVAVLALSSGRGFDRAFRDFGAKVAPLGEMVKPSAGDIARAADAMGVPDVIVLPNHENVLLSAQQAVDLTGCDLHVVPSKTLPQGLAALLSYDPEQGIAHNVREMKAGLDGVATVEVTQATADRTADGVDVKAGEFIALAEGRLVASTADALTALVEGARAAAPEDASLVSVFLGQDANVDEAEISGRLGAELPGAELEIVDGGQALYVFIASIE